jgi:hypothetical protein
MAKKNKVKDAFLDELRKIPIIQVACEKTGISRNSIYRWRHKDKKFEKELEEALNEGEALVNDMSEHQLLSLIKEKNFSAVRFWLNRRHPKFKDKVEVTTNIGLHDDELSPEEKRDKKRALELAIYTKPNKENYDNRDTKNN